MNLSDQTRALNSAIQTARAAGQLIRRNLHRTKAINSFTRHDIKLELDVRCQKLIEQRLRSRFPTIALLGEEGVVGNPNSTRRWVVDPIDGTVNFTYGIPHACVSIALQEYTHSPDDADYHDQYRTLIGVVYDPFTDELWSAIRGRTARLNNHPIAASRRTKLSEAIVSIGFAKNKNSLQKTLPYFNWLAPRVRKIRMLGAAALGLTYVATGRFDAYVERGIRLWDIAAGGLIIECAGGSFQRQPTNAPHTYRILASNQPLKKKLPLPT